MRKVLFFMMTSLNGFYERGAWEIDWHHVDDEFTKFSIEQIETVDTLLFGRATYEGMAAYWPTEAAAADSPTVTAKMNETPKIVFSRTMERADWENTRLVRSDAAEEVARLKSQPGKDLIIFGSSDLAASLAKHGLIDEYRINVQPVALGDGLPLLHGLDEPLRLELVSSTAWADGPITQTYIPR